MDLVEESRVGGSEETARTATEPRLDVCILPLEVRIHGRGGQGGVTCAKLIASLFSERGAYVQAFGEYGSERAGAPVRAYARAALEPIRNRNRVYQPDHLLVLDPTLLSDDIVDGVVAGGVLLLNSSEPLDAYDGRFPGLRLAVVDATRIARDHGIGSRSKVIVNTTVVGAYACVAGLPLGTLGCAFESLGLSAANLDAAREAFAAVSIRDPHVAEAADVISAAAAAGAETGGRLSFWGHGASSSPDVLALTEHTKDLPTRLKTGNWRTQRVLHSRRMSPCHLACPAGNDIPGFVHVLRSEGVEAAAHVLWRTQPFPSICGRVCPAPCQIQCNRAEIDEHVNIRGLERWVGDTVSAGFEPVALVEQPRAVAIVGSGPAGLSAAYAVRREGHRATVFEAESELGGVLRYGIPEYRLPAAVLRREVERLLALGVEAVSAERVGPAALSRLRGEFDAVIVACGRPVPRGLSCAGSDLPEIEPGLAFLRRGAPHFDVPRDGHVVVVGGGNTAVDCARTALRAGASKVTLVYRRTRGDMPAVGEEVEQAMEEGVELLECHVPVGLASTAGEVRVEVAEVQAGPLLVEGRPRPIPTGRVGFLACDQVLVAIGQSGDPDIVPAGWSIEAGRAYVGPEELNVFVAGDFATGAGTVAHAIGDGRSVALQALRSLDALPPGPPPPDPSEAVKASELRARFRGKEPSARERVLPVELRLRGFGEVNRGLADSGEAERCFSCGTCTSCDTCVVYCPEGIVRGGDGAYSVDGDYCKGCGICAAECPGGVMRMVSEVAT